jgi:Na+-driven multidrug efflux pump
MVAGTDAVAVYSTGWRVVMMAIIPILAVGMATVAVIGASYGARRFDRIAIAHSYSIKLGFVVALITGALTYVFAPYISQVFCVRL